MSWWPLGGLELRCDDLLLRPARDGDFAEMGRIVHGLFPDPTQRRFMPGLVVGALRADLAETTTRVAQWTWANRAQLTAEDWKIELAVIRRGAVLGMQSLEAAGFSVRREVHTGSYLATQWRGQGIGTRMRAMVVEFAFGWLGALTATSGYVAGNTSSAGVSARLGYEPDGRAVREFDGARYDEHLVRLDRGRWADYRPAWLDGMTVTGAEPVKTLLGGSPT